jgi:hypothetical protein
LKDVVVEVWTALREGLEEAIAVVEGSAEEKKERTIVTSRCTTITMREVSVATMIE